MNKADYLNQLKAHDWTYDYASGDAYRRGRDNQARLVTLAAKCEELNALYIAYSAFIWEGGQEPSLMAVATEDTQAITAVATSTQQVKRVKIHNKQAIMWDAWTIAHKAARNFGGRAIIYMATSLRQAWAKAKAKVLSSFNTNRTNKAAYYICIDEKTGRNTRQINQPVIDEVFTDRGEALAALQILNHAFTKPVIKSSPHFHL